MFIDGFMAGWQQQKDVFAFSDDVYFIQPVGLLPAGPAIQEKYKKTNFQCSHQCPLSGENIIYL